MYRYLAITLAKKNKILRQNENTYYTSNLNLLAIVPMMLHVEIIPFWPVVPEKSTFKYLSVSCPKDASCQISKHLTCWFMR